jgi:structural maintenance of chromosome 1
MARLFQIGRMSDLCQPVHERYKLAITKVMGKNLSALIVQNKQTALEVINYLKTLHIPPEVILPLDTIKVYPIQGRLRYVNGKQLFICLLFTKRTMPQVNSNPQI